MNSLLLPAPLIVYFMAAAQHNAGQVIGQKLAKSILLAKGQGKGYLAGATDLT
jgi:hypothetical protein